MRILQITPQAPGYKSGGEIGVVQTLKSLTGNGYLVDYIGPCINDKSLRKLYNKVYELEPTKNVFFRVFDLLCGISNSRYRAWKNLNLNMDKYDVVVMDFTKLNFVTDKVPKNKLLVRVHNIEFDYSSIDYEKEKSFRKYLIKTIAPKQERDIVQNCKKLVALTENDAERIKCLYKTSADIDIVPVCVENKFEEKQVYISNLSSILNILITGSLWFGENYDGIVWFIRNVCPRLKLEYKLTIAGACPSDELKEMVSANSKIRIIDSPENMDVYFHNADLVICPIFSGAGMKVKVAEAFSYGLPVVGTRHAFIGYDVKDGINSFFANSKEEFSASITKFYYMSSNEKKEMYANVRKLFNEKYDIDISTKLWKQIIELSQK